MATIPETIFPAQSMTLENVDGYLLNASRTLRKTQDPALHDALDTFLLPTLSCIRNTNQTAHIDQKTGEIFHAMVENQGKITTINKLGKGQYGIVDLVKVGDITFAKKRPRPEKDPHKKRQIDFVFNNERSKMWGVKSDRVIQILGVDKEGAIYMTYANGGDVKGAIKAFTEEKVHQFALDALTALSNLTTAHMDVKPDNFFIHDNHYLLGDFGFSGLQNAGTPIYMAPEVLTSSIDATKADYWSLGMTLVAVLSKGEPLFTLTDVKVRFEKKAPRTQKEINHSIRQLSSKTKQLDPTGVIIAIANKLLTVDAEKRSTPSDLLIEFHDFFFGPRIQKIMSLPFPASHFAFITRQLEESLAASWIEQSEIHKPAQAIGMVAMGISGEVIDAPVLGEYIDELEGSISSSRLYQYVNDLITIVQKLPPEAIDLTPNTLLFENEKIYVSWKTSSRRRKEYERIYTPPEQLGTFENNTHDGLVWQLGLVLFYLVTNQDLFVHEGQILDKTYLTRRLKSLTSYREIIEGMLQHAPDKRRLTT